jgi:hypothetical protein
MVAWLMDEMSKSEVATLVNCPFDFEILGSLFYQAREFRIFYNFPQSEEKKNKWDKFMGIVLDASMKLAAMKYHVDNYKRFESICMGQLAAKCEEKGEATLQAYELLYELESFLFQTKSSLDIAVKFIGVMFPGRFKVKTFGDKGNNIIEGLTKFKKDKSARSDIIDYLISSIKADQDSWLNETIRLRDTCAHFKASSGYRYSAKLVDKTLYVKAPELFGFNVSNSIEIIYKNCLEFIQEFMCFVIVMEMPAHIHLNTRGNNPVSVGEPIDQYVKFCIGFDLNKETIE